METTKFIKQLPSLLFLSGALVFTSCENNSRTERDTATDNRDNIGTTDERAVDTYDMTETDYNIRRNRVATNLDQEITKARTEAEDLRQRANSSTVEERDELQHQIERLEARIENLEEQQESLENSNMENWEETERDIETRLQDREGNYEQTRGEENATELGTGRSSDVGPGTQIQSDTETSNDTVGRDTETDQNRINQTGTETKDTRTETTGEMGTHNVE